MKNIKPKFLIPVISIGTLITYTFGNIMFFVGATFKDKIPLRLATDLFNQAKFIRLAANLFGLQFLTLLNTEYKAVDASVSSLLLARLVFFDTFLSTEQGRATDCLSKRCQSLHVYHCSAGRARNRRVKTGPSNTTPHFFTDY